MKTMSMNVTVSVWLGMVHVCAVALGILFFNWWGVTVAAGLYAVTALGVTMGYHRLLTHGSFKTYPWLRNCLALAGALSGEGPPAVWVAFHRRHHQCSDRAGDPHSPQEGFWHAHVLWMLWSRDDVQELLQRYAPDICRERFMNVLHDWYMAWHFLLGGLLFAAGWLAQGAWFGWSLVAYGIFVRMVCVLHVTWCVNSATHRWGYRNYTDTDDESRNLWWVAWLAFGEGWHNNHHAHPAAANHGFHRWWEVDATYLLIVMLERCGLAWDIRWVRPTLS